MFISLHMAYNSPTRPVTIRISEARMKNSQQQADYWDRAAAKKIFTHPLQLETFSRLVNRQARILDYGCGYGRICNELSRQGYTDLVGADISAAMIARGRALYPQLDLRHIPELNLPFAGQSFDACLLFAVLNCVPAESGSACINRRTAPPAAPRRRTLPERLPAADRPQKPGTLRQVSGKIRLLRDL